MTKSEAIKELERLSNLQIKLFSNYDWNNRINNRDRLQLLKETYYPAQSLYKRINQLRFKYNIPCYSKMLEHRRISKWIYFPVKYDNP